MDGSDSALDATRWAVGEARLRGAPLRLVHACVLPPVRHLTEAAELRWAEIMVEHGERVLAEAAAAALAVDPSVRVGVHQRVGRPVDVLVEESERACSVVLGARGLGGFRELVVGSVSTGSAAHAHAPVIVVRGVRDDQAPPAGPVVVGVDGSPAGEAAIAFAFEQATLRGVPLRAVHSKPDAPRGGERDAPPALTEDERLSLDRLLAGWLEKHPDVPVERVVVRDRPVRALLDQAEGAPLVVVGSRGHGVLVGMGLGPTSQSLLHHAMCPVAVVRPPHGDD